MVTLKEIAEECGVSTVTVSNVLNDKKNVSESTRQRVMEVVEKYGYQPNIVARGLRSRKTRTIGVIAEDITQFTTPPIIEGIMRQCEKTDFRTIVTNLRLYARWSDRWYHNEEVFRSALDPAMKNMESLMVDGLIYVAGHAREINVFHPEKPIPGVMVYAYERNPGITSVVLDDVQGAYEMVRYLIAHGHHRIAVLAGREPNIHTQKRIQGYQRALFEAGILFDPDLIVYSDWQREGGFIDAPKVLSKNCTAVYCMADRMAGGLYAYMAHHGLRPGVDLSVASCDNQDMSEYLIPGLTTMELPLYEIGKTAMKELVDRIEGKQQKQEGRKIYLPFKLVERESVVNLI